MRVLKYFEGTGSKVGAASGCRLVAQIDAAGKSRPVSELNRELREKASHLTDVQNSIVTRMRLLQRELEQVNTELEQVADSRFKLNREMLNLS